MAINFGKLEMGIPLQGKPLLIQGIAKPLGTETVQQLSHQIPSTRKRKRNSHGKDPETFQKNKKGPTYPSPQNQNGEKGKKCIPKEEYRQKEKKGGGER